MNESPENFDKLVKLLGLKKHEQPPPGYFHQLSGEIMARLRDEQAERRSSWLDFADDATWAQKIWGLLEARPAVAGFFGVAVSSLLLGGIIYSQNLARPAPVAIAPPPVRESLAFADPVALPHPDQVASSLLVSSTNPVADPLGPAGLFDGVRLRNQTPVPVSLNIGGN